MGTWSAWNRPRVAAAIGACLMLAACQGKSGAADETAQATPPAAPTAATAPAPAAPAPVATPQTEAVDTVLAAAKTYNTDAAKLLAAIAQDEAKIRAAAQRAADAAKGVEAASAGQRQALGARITAARREADAARDRLADGQAKLKSDTDLQITAVENNMGTCAATPELAAYAGCQALEAEHAVLLQNIEALTKRYEAALAAYQAEQGKLEEASAAVALAALR